MLRSTSFVLLVLLLSCGPSAPPGPVTVNGLTLPVGDGQVLARFTGVPRFNVTWDPLVEPANEAAVAFFSYGLSPEARERGAQVTLQLGGRDAASFVVDAEAFNEGSVRGSVRCVPQAAGALEAELVATVEGASYRGLLRCEAVTDYALFANPGATEPAVCVADGRVLLPGGQVYALATGEKRADASAPSCPTLPGERVEDLRAELAPDGSFVVVLADGSRKPMLTAAEVQSVGGTLGSVRVSADASAVAFVTARGLYVRDEQPLRELNPWTTPVAARRVYGFDATGQKLVVSATPSTSGLRSRALWLVVDRGTGAATPLIPSSLTGLPDAANLFAFTPALDRVVWGLGGNGQLDLFLVDRAAGAASRLFDEAMTHVRTLAGRSAQAPITLVSQVPQLSLDGRYLALTLEAFTGADYYFGPKAVYVRDLQEGTTWLVSVLPDGTPLSGDGWGYGDVPSVSGDGAFATWTAVWTAGSAGGGRRFGFSAVVPRRLWVPL